MTLGHSKNITLLLFTQSHPTLFDSMDCNMPDFPLLHYLLEFVQIHVHWVGNAIQPSHPMPPLSLFTFNLSQHQALFQWVSPLHQVDKVLELQLQHQSFQWIFRTDFLLDWLIWSPCLISSFDLQGTLKSLLQHHSSKASVLQCSDFLMFQLSNPYMTTGKTIALTITVAQD